MTIANIGATSNAFDRMQWIVIGHASRLASALFVNRHLHNLPPQQEISISEFASKCNVQLDTAKSLIAPCLSTPNSIQPGQSKDCFVFTSPVVSADHHKTFESRMIPALLSAMEAESGPDLTRLSQIKVEGISLFDLSDHTASKPLAELAMHVRSLPIFEVHANPVETASLVAIGILYFTGLFRKIPADGASSLSTIAVQNGYPKEILQPMLQYASIMGIGFLDAKDVVSHTETSKLLAFDSNIQGAVGHQLCLVLPAMINLALYAQIMTRESTRCTAAFNLAFNTTLPSSIFIGQQDRYRERFGSSMKALARTSFMSVLHLVDGFDWNSLPQGTIVDVGGGTGTLARAVADRLPGRTIIVQDLEQVVSNAAQSDPDNQVGQIKFMAQDILEPNAIMEPAAFVTRIVLHNFPRPDIVRILRQLARAMRPGHTRLIIAEIIVPDTLSHPMAPYISALDLTMLAMFNGRERSLDDWRAVMEEADPALELLQCDSPANSAIGYMVLIKHV